MLHALPLSFFSRDLYLDVGRNWRGAGLLYLLFVVALATALIVIHMQVALLRWSHGDASQMVSQIPSIQIRHGIVHVDRATPYFIRNPNNDSVVAVIDTSGSIGSLEGSGAMVLLTRDHLFMRKSGAETRVFDLSRVDNFSVDRARAAGWLRALATWLAIVCAPFILAGLYAFRLIQQLIGAVIGWLIGSASGVSLDFEARMRLTAIALTPALVVEMALTEMHATPSSWGLLWTAITVGYLVIAIRSNREGMDAAPAVEPQAPSAPQ